MGDKQVSLRTENNNIQSFLFLVLQVGQAISHKFT